MIWFLTKSKKKYVAEEQKKKISQEGKEERFDFDPPIPGSMWNSGKVDCCLVGNAVTMAQVFVSSQNYFFFKMKIHD